MTTFLVRRLFQSILFLAISALLIYTVIVMLMPEGPYRRYAVRGQMITATVQDPKTHTTTVVTFPADVSKVEIEQAEKVYKLDKPWPINFLYWLFDPNDYTQVDNTTFETVPKGIDVNIFGLRVRGSGVLSGSFGNSASVANGRPVSELIGTRLFNSVLLLGVALALSTLVAIPAGALAAAKQGSALDRALTFSSFVMLSMPPFVTGLLLILFLAVLPKVWREQGNLWWLPYLPTGDATSDGDEGVFSHLYHIVLPAFTLALAQGAALSRYVRFSMLDVLQREYIRTAWAKGLRWRQVIFRHALRNALIPIITVVGMALPGLLTGAIVVEALFHYSGLGYLFYKSVSGFGQIDTSLMLVLTLLMSAVVVFSNLMADLLYIVTDPRIVFDVKLSR